VEVDAACMLAAGESQVGRRLSLPKFYLPVRRDWSNWNGSRSKRQRRLTMSSDHSRVTGTAFAPNKAFFMVRPEACHSFTISKIITVA